MSYTARAIAADQDYALAADISNPEAEASLLSMMMLDARRVDIVVGRVAASDFSEPVFGRIYERIVQLIGEGKDATPVTLHPYFVNDPAIAQLGGVGILATLTASNTPLMLRPGATADLIRDLSRRRALVEGMKALVAEACSDPDATLDSLVARGDAVLGEALISPAKRTAIKLATAWDAAIGKVRAIGAGEISRGAMIAGLPEWNDICGGMSPGQFILLGGRPSMGKTALALMIARGAAEKGHGVLFISREMPVEQLMFRLIADMMFEAGARVTLDDILNGRLSETDYRRAEQIRAQIEAWPFAFEEPETLNAASVAPLIRKHRRQFEAAGVGMALVVVDYLQLLDPPQRRQGREQEVSDISRTLKSAARANDVAVLALAQLSRALESREDKRPQLSDLRDSGSLEQDADTVVFVYRAQYYLERMEPPADQKRREAYELELGAERNRIDIFSAKVRQGAVKRRKCFFFGQHQAIRTDDFYRMGGSL